MKANHKTGLTYIGIAVIFTGLSSLTGVAYAQASEASAEQAKDKLRKRGDEVVLLMQAVGAAFECSELARWSAEPVERKRLFMYGYDAGMRLIPAWSAYEILEKSSDQRDELVIQQTPDFQLGAFFEMARHSAEKQVFEPKVSDNFEAVWKKRAAAQFEKLNCRLIGLGARQ